MDNAVMATTLRIRIRDLLTARRWSQAQLAEASGLQPSVVSRLLAGSRPWKQEHIARIAAALSTSPEELTKGIDASLELTGPLAEHFVATLTKDHGTLVGENERLTEELAATKQQLRKLVEEREELRSSDEREQRLRTTAESELRAARHQQNELENQNRTLRRERAVLMADLDGVRQQLNIAWASHANATEIANRNYAIATDLQAKLSTATGVAAVTGLVGLAMVLSKAFDNGS